MEMGRLTRDGTTEPLSRDQILRRELGQGVINFPCSADRQQDWQIYPIDPYSCYMCEHTYIHTIFDSRMPGLYPIAYRATLPAFFMRLPLGCFYCMCVFVCVFYFIATMSFAGYFLVSSLLSAFPAYLRFPV